MESALRPRDIQARIRAGESLEEVALAAGVPPERIEPFAAPVLAEREHLAGLAQTNPIRRGGEAVAHRALRSVVAERLLAEGVDIDDVSWDAWRVQERRWTVRVSVAVGDTAREAEFTYDQTGRFSVAANADARWLTGEDAPPRSAAAARRNDPEATVDLNDDLALVRAIQPPFSITPDLPDEDDNDGTDNEDAFAEGELAEVDGIYDLVPGDSSNMDVLYDMLSTFDEDSVQIYAGLVRPRDDEEAAPVLDRGPEPVEEPGNDEPTAVLLPEPEPDEIEDVTDAEEAGEAEEAAEAAGSDEPAAEVSAPEAEVAANQTEGVAEPEAAAEAEPVAAVEVVAEPVAADEPGAARAEPQAVSTTEPEAPAEPKPAPRPRQRERKPVTEPEQPSLVDPAGNEPSRPIKRKRASVPSWDEIMFGSPKPPTSR